MSRLKLWLIRHGETELNTGIWTSNPTETHLTSLGKDQAQKAATRIIEPPDLIIISPLMRARETATYFCNQWPGVEACIWPIQEFLYLSPKRLSDLDKLGRLNEISQYWEKNDPHYCDNEGTESFASFLQRVSNFHQKIEKLEGFVIVIGHGQFFTAYQLGLDYGFRADSAWMSLFRQHETANPIKNGEIIQIQLY